MQSVRKRGGIDGGAWARGGNHFDSNNTLPLISLISSFLWLKVYYSRKSAAVVFARDETLPTLVTTAHGREATAYVMRSCTYTYFRPLVIRIGLLYHLHLEMQRKRKGA